MLSPIGDEIAGIMQERGMHDSPFSLLALKQPVDPKSVRTLDQAESTIRAVTIPDKVMNV
jgi:hypothetical protein